MAAQKALSSQRDLKQKEERAMLEKSEYMVSNQTTEPK